MADRKLPWGTRLYLAASGISEYRGVLRDEKHRLMEDILREPRPDDATPGVLMLEGAARAFCKAGPHHPQRRLLIGFLIEACAFAAQDMRPTRLRYTGGALRHFEKDDGDARA